MALANSTRVSEGAVHSTNGSFQCSRRMERPDAFSRWHLDLTAISRAPRKRGQIQ